MRKSSKDATIDSKNEVTIDSKHYCCKKRSKLCGDSASEITANVIAVARSQAALYNAIDIMI